MDGSVESSEWQRFAASILSGLGHDLSGRVTALLGIAHVIRAAGGSLEAELLDDLDAELVKLKQAVVLLRRLASDGAREPRPDRMREVIRDVAQLYRLAGGSPVLVAGADEPGHGPRIWLASPILSRALLLVLRSVERTAPGSSLRIRLVSSEDGSERIEIEAVTRDGILVGEPDGEATFEEARDLIESLGGVVVREASGVSAPRVAISLPAVDPPRHLPRGWEG